MSPVTCRSRRRVLGAAVLAALLAVPTAGAEAATASPGSQGTDTSLPPTDSQVTVHGRGAYADLAITVNQTRQLTNQAVSITWTGGTPTVSGVGRFEAHYLQIMQCWGDDDGTNADNPGPPPEQCEFGAAGGTPNGLPGSLFYEGLAIGRVISRSSWQNFDPSVGYLDARSTNVWRPFRAVDGTVVNVQTDPEFNPFLGGNYWLNPYFNQITTNEIPGAVTGADGKGAELFQVLTANESSGLGCGRKVQPVEGGGTKTPKCWIVVVPRSDQATENVGTPMESFGARVPVGTSPLAPAAWQHRIAIPIDFNPVDSPCVFADVERRIAGSELPLRAVASWQPALCAQGSLPPFSYAPVADATARSLLTSGVDGAPGMALVSRPVDPTTVSDDNPVVYAPVSASGIVIGFNVERKADIGAPPTMKQLEGVRVAELNLTPRLVAKLLTQSYTDQVSIIQPPKYAWLAHNPANLSLDPDFLAFNPEFDLMYVANGRTFSGLQLPAGNSDAALQLWEWIFADPEARAWLSGEPDPWGMVVNPYYVADAAKNPSGIPFGSPLPNSFPKADPYCYQGPKQGPADSITPPLLCGTDWMPYARGFADTAQITRAASDSARISLNQLAETASQVWGKVGPQYIGERAMLSVTDTPSATQYGVQMARLSRAGDDGVERTFIAPTTDSLAKGVAAMVEGDVPGVLEPDSGADAPDAYPLTAVTYAAVAPLSLDAQARRDYAAFLEYVTGTGQVPGLEIGQLPQGYTPLPPAMRARAATAIDEVRNLQLPPATTTTTTTTFPRSSGGGGGSYVPPSTQDVDTSTGTTLPTDTTVPTTDSPTTTTLDPADVPDSTTPTLLTPVVALSRSRYALPGLGIVALGSALGALEITKRPRRRRMAAAPDTVEVVDVGGE